MLNNIDNYLRIEKDEYIEAVSESSQYYCNRLQ